VYRNALPQLGDDLLLTDSGLETDLIFHGGVELPEFAAFVLVEDPAGVVALDSYYRRHVDIAVDHRCGVVLEAPTWRASSDWGARLGYSESDLRRVNEAAVSVLERVRQDCAAQTASPVVVSGCIGPRADAYSAAERMPADAAEAYHRPQIETIAGTSADMVHAMTLTYADEAIGIVRAAARVGIPVVVSFTTETDGRVPDGSTLSEAISAVDTATDGAAAYFGVNCAHPSHFASALPAGDVASRVRSIRANASRKSHAELDESPTLDEGDPVELAADYAHLLARHPQLRVLGGCCGTDARHVRAIADACLTSATPAS
jgi:homocysteine S-methyltransferase